MSTTQSSAHWAEVKGARTYNVKSQDGNDATLRTLATRLVSAAFAGITPYKGTSTFVVTAVNSNGESAPSQPVSVDLQKAAAVERSHAPVH